MRDAREIAEIMLPNLVAASHVNNNNINNNSKKTFSYNFEFMKVSNLFVKMSKNIICEDSSLLRCLCFRLNWVMVLSKISISAIGASVLVMVPNQNITGSRFIRSCIILHIDN